MIFVDKLHSQDYPFVWVYYTFYYKENDRIYNHKHTSEQQNPFGNVSETEFLACT